MRHPILLILILILIAATVAARPQQPAASVDPPAGEHLVLQLHAEGVQIYSCVTDNGAPAWKFLAPEAKLIAADGSPAGTHSAGPTWKLLDGSEVKGSPVASKPASDAGAVPWLLLKVASETGDGKLHAVEYITRTNTKGGVAPQSGCDASHPGAQARIPYSATYSFYGK